MNKERLEEGLHGCGRRHETLSPRRAQTSEFLITYGSRADAGTSWLRFSLPGNPCHPPRRKVSDSRVCSPRILPLPCPPLPLGREGECT